MSSIGYPEPNAGDRRLCRKLVQKYKDIVSKRTPPAAHTKGHEHVQVEQSKKKSSGWSIKGKAKRYLQTWSSEVELSPVHESLDAPVDSDQETMTDVLASVDELRLQKPNMDVQCVGLEDADDDNVDILEMLRGDNMKDNCKSPIYLIFIHALVLLVTAEYVDFRLKYFGDIPRRWCDMCLVQQPIRAKHCYEAGQCVLRFDHYCKFTGMVVGQNNHFVFWLWLLIETLTIMSVLASLALPFFYPAYDVQWIKYDASVILAGIAIILLIPALIIVGGVFVFQTGLVLTNQTTPEKIRVTGKIRSWPWYFRYLVLGYHDLDQQMISQARIIQIDPNNLEGKQFEQNPFSQESLLLNFGNFVAMGVRNMPDRGLDRWKLDGVVISSMVDQERGKDGEYGKVKYVRDGWVKRLYIDEVESIEIPKAFAARLQTEFSQESLV